ncbi:hypothetical protein ANO11243_023350 [Dothideomycetidae sp. 11243]|nr:hypothetical protein ANO11243_023350 [fungal sp. No.11243]
MAEGGRDRQLSLIPYASNQSEVVLRHGTAVVTVDPRSQQLTLRNTESEAVEYGACPYCHRPYHDEQSPYADPHDRVSPPPESSFVNPDYFRMLAENNSDGTTSNSPPASPSRPLRALRSGQSRNVSASTPLASAGANSSRSSTPPLHSEQASHGIRSSSFAPGYFKRFFTERRTLGRGGRGVVLLVEHKLDGVSLGDFAVKRIPVGNDHDWLAKVLVEVVLLSRLIHPNLVAYRHAWLEDMQITKFGPSVPCVFILQQYCNAGDLQQYVQTATTFQNASRSKGRKGSTTESIRSGQLSLDEILAFFGDITSGLNYLHANGFIHRDLKPSNCLLHNDGRKITVHVSDFGEVQVATAERASTGATGTISYCAPEVLTRETPEGLYGNFTTKSDIFSLGMILFYMCFGTLPYVHADVNEENEDIDLLRAEIAAWSGFTSSARKRQDLPDKLYEVLRRLLSVEPHDRPSTAEILASAQGNGDGDSPRFTSSEGFTASDGPPATLQRRRSSNQQPPQRWHSHSRPSHQRWLSTESIAIAQASGGASPPQPAEDSSRRSPITPSPRRASHPDIQHPPSSSETENSISSPTRRNNKSPRLLLPPPPPSRFRPSLLHTPGLRTALFLTKLLSLTWPCLPYATRPGLLYPLLGLAAWALVADLSPFGEVLGLLVHGAVLFVASRGRGGTCAALPVVDEVPLGYTMPRTE